MAMLPWMHAVETSQLLAAVTALAPARVLEWGSGGSTRLFLEACPFVEEWIAIEHDPAWYERVRAAVADPRLNLQLIMPEVPPKENATPQELYDWAVEAERDAGVLRRYVEHPVTLGPFDFVLVDGRARRFCLPAGFGALRSGGVLALHDAQRTGYHSAFVHLGPVIFLEPFVGGQIALLRKP